MTDYQPQPTLKNCVTFGQARFVLLTERMLRLEWAEDDRFEDHATLAVVHRALPPVAHIMHSQGKTLTLTTSGFTLTYTDNGQHFRAENLAVTFSLNGETVIWRPGLHDSENLGATLRTLDQMKGNQRPVTVGTNRKTGATKYKWSPVDLGTGFISRSGWALIDDSRNVLLTNEPEWVAPRQTGERQDWYLLMHGHDYVGALSESAQVFGRQPLPPRYSFGYWWSRYWAYTDRELEEIVKQFDQHGVPIDVMVIDMDWHLEGWTGYTWNRRYFPDPVDFLHWLKLHDLKITLNLHPSDGVGKHEAAFPAMADALGLNPKKVDRVPFDITDPRYMNAYFRLLHHPLETAGVDFWWMDWHQGDASAMPGLDTLLWINHLHWHDMARNGARHGMRPLIFSRFGGYGAGRYCIGFSGDTYSEWESLQFQPYFTATAANVLYGYWSHDIGGHMPGEIEPELYTRWIQFGLYAPILRTHCSKNPDAERRVWEYPAPYSDIMRETIRQRYELVPYLYTEARHCYETGVSLCRPLYYDYPEIEEAYHAKNQYFCGSQLLIAPVLTPVSTRDDMAKMQLWLPEGRWFDIARGCFEEGGQSVTRRYLINEVPVFVRPGAILPGQPVSTRLQAGSYPDLVITAYPGGNGAYALYEDDGVSSDYQAHGFAWIPLSQRYFGRDRHITIGAAQGYFQGFLVERAVEIRLPGSVPPAAIRVGKKMLAWAYRLGDSGWSYDGDTATIIIRLPRVEVTGDTIITVEGHPAYREDIADGLKGMMTRLARVKYYNTLATTGVVLQQRDRLGVEAAQTGDRISRNPSSFTAEMASLSHVLAQMPGMFAKLGAVASHGEGSQPDARRKAYCEKARLILRGLRQEMRAQKLGANMR